MSRNEITQGRIQCPTCNLDVDDGFIVGGEERFGDSGFGQQNQPTSNMEGTQ
jgi:hypothetical protein